MTPRSLQEMATSGVLAEVRHLNWGETQMNRFFELTFRPFFVLTGRERRWRRLYAFWPRWTVEKLQKIAFVQDYAILSNTGGSWSD